MSYFAKFHRLDLVFLRGDFAGLDAAGRMLLSAMPGMRAWGLWKKGANVMSGLFETQATVLIYLMKDQPGNYMKVSLTFFNISNIFNIKHGWH